MSAFDRLQNYSAKRGVNESSDVFDVTTPEGAFLNRIHQEGYAMYIKTYKLKDECRLSDTDYAQLSLDDMLSYDSSLVISESVYNTLSDFEKSKYDYEVKFTELHDVLTTKGNQIINAVAGSGKSLKNGTRVHTDNGFVPIEKLKVGDLVYSDDGKLHSVVGVYPQNKLLQEYECIFENGVTIICSGDHLWTDFDGITRSTDEMYLNKPRHGFVLPKVLPKFDENCKTNKFICMSIEEREELIEDFRENQPDSLTPLVFNFFEDYTDAIELYKSLGYAVLNVDEENDCCYSFIPKRHHRIIDIVKTNSYSEMTCIEIDSPTHLYLTEADIPTHNTTGLVLKILHDIVTGEAMTLQGVPGGTQVRVVNKMWVCTFLKTGATELEQALTNWQRKLGYSQTSNQISFSTMDAEFKRCLNAMGVETPIGDAGKIHGLLVKAVNACNITRDGGYGLSNEDYQIIASIVTYYRGRLDQKRYQHPSCLDYGLTPSILDLLVKQFENLRHAEGVMDFEEIMELLYKYLYVTPNPAVQDFVANRYNYIYADEFQDTSQMAYAILKFYARGKLAMNQTGIKPTENGVETIDNGTVLDDSDGHLSIKKSTIQTQPIMTDGLFTGSTTLGKFSVVGDVSQTIYSFRGSDSKILFEEVPRDFNPTCNTLSVNWRCPKNILSPVVPSIHNNPDSAKQDIIASREGGEFYAYKFTSYKNMVTQLKKDMLKDMDEGLSVAILCRTNFDGMIPAFVLESEGKFDFSISGENMTLNSPLPRKIIGVSALFTERSTPAVKNALAFFVGKRGEWQLKQLMDILKTNNKNIWQIPIQDINYSCPAITDIVTEIRDIIMPDGVNRDKSKEVEALKAIYCRMITDVFYHDSAYCESARAYIETLLYIIDNNNFKTIYEFLEEIEFLNDKLAGRIKKSKAPIQIATVHEFKGKERDSVYIWNDSEGTFPSSKCDDNDPEQLAEERRVHYIACTRAKKREHIYTLATKVSRFVQEMDLILENPIGVGVSLKK